MNYYKEFLRVTVLLACWILSGHCTQEGGQQGIVSGDVKFEDAIARIDSLLITTLEDQRIPGLAAGIVVGDSLKWANGYGIRAIDDPVAVAPVTRFRIASITKLFTATAIMMLHENELLSIRQPVRQYLDWFDMDRPNQPEVRIEHLLTHTAGMPRDSRLTDFSRLYQPGRNEAIEALRDQSLTSRPGEAYAYSNLGFALLGETIAQVSRKSYNQFLREDIFAPLKMFSSLAHPRLTDTTAWGHGPLKSDQTRNKAGFWDLRFATPAGGMATSVVDLSKFAVDQLAPYQGNSSALLEDSTIFAMHEVQFVTDSVRGGMGIGWAVEISGGQHTIYHGGELPEQSSFILLDLKNSIGILLMCNAQDIDVYSLSYDMLDIIKAVKENTRED